jgi:hypothetical protein
MSLGVDENYTQDDRICKDIIFSGNILRCNGERGFYLQGSQPDELTRITITNNHIYDSSTPIDVRCSESAIIDNVIYNSTSPISVVTGDVASGVSSTGWSNILQGNKYINNTFPRGVGTGMYFAADNIIREVSFAAQGENLVFGGSLGTGGTVTFPDDSSNNEAKYLRATIGSAAMTRDYRFVFRCRQYNLDCMDSVSVQLLTKSSAQNMGRLEIRFPGSTMADGAIDLNDRADFATWKMQGLTRQINSGITNVRATTALCEVHLLVGENGTAGNTFDISWLRIAIGTLQQGTRHPLILDCIGSPEGVLTAPIGTLCQDWSGGKLYVKETAASVTTGWVLK